MLILYKKNESHFHGGNTGSNPVGDAIRFRTTNLSPKKPQDISSISLPINHD